MASSRGQTGYCGFGAFVPSRSREWPKRLSLEFGHCSASSAAAKAIILAETIWSLVNKPCRLGKNIRLITNDLQKFSKIFSSSLTPFSARFLPPKPT